MDGNGYGFDNVNDAASDTQQEQQAMHAPKRVRKSVDQQIAEAEERLRKLKAKKSSEDRKARTKRLIETGAVVEKALGAEFASQESREALLAVLCEARPRKNGDGTWTWGGEISRAVAERMQR